jgi:hypothetical protein
MRHSVVLLALVLSGGLAARGQDEEQERTVTGAEPYHGVLQYRAKDAKLALVRPSFLTAEQAALPAGVSVVGVTVGDEHRAYPLYVLKNHQVVNDRLGNVPIAASW